MKRKFLITFGLMIPIVNDLDLIGRHYGETHQKHRHWILRRIFVSNSRQKYFFIRYLWHQKTVLTRKQVLHRQSETGQDEDPP